MVEKRKSASDSGKQPKRTKTDNDFDDIPCSFEEELALLDSVERDSQSSKTDSQSQHAAEHKQRLTQNRTNKWRRPDAPNLDPKKDALIFQQIEVEHYTGKQLLYFRTFCFDVQRDTTCA